MISSVYVLELAGEDDGFAVREAQSSCSAVSLLAPGLATADGISRIESLALTHRASSLIGHSSAAIEEADRRAHV